jgi:large subunit ribosomal protein L4
VEGIIMASLTIFDKAGKEVGKYDVEPGVFAPEINKQLLHDAIVMYQANLRQGTAASKSRGMIAGSTKKMYRQKGTGNARAGSRRSPIRRGGGHTFRKDPRDFGYRLPRKALQLATRMAIASKLNDGEVTVIDSLEFKAPKTRDMAGILKALKIDQGTCLVTTATQDRNVWLSARNINGVEISPAADLNAYKVLMSRRMLVTREALDALAEGAKSNGKQTSEKSTAPKSRLPAKRTTKPAAARGGSKSETKGRKPAQRAPKGK